jgi:hypothetical protein
MAKKQFIKLGGLAVFLSLSLGSATDQELRADRERRCANSFGYSYGSDAMAQCVERMARDRDRALERMNACIQRFPFGSPAYNICISR